MNFEKGSLLITEEEAAHFGKGREQHGRSHFADDPADVSVVGFVGTPGFALVRLDQDEDVVHAHSQHQERDHLKQHQSINYRS